MNDLAESLRTLVGDAETVGVVVVDHGSRRQQSNLLLDDVVAMFQRVTGFELVEAAHMELAEPSIETAMARCVERGASLVVVFPYFLSPGRHWSEDIPRLAAAAAAQHPGVRHLVTAPIGLHDAMADIMRGRIEHCVARAVAGDQACPHCQEATGCQLAEAR
ncbi:MAG: CbiX/SirB N-terminal domain-containing protein [Planctomycetota bacterium]